jgi:hypothetical protein
VAHLVRTQSILPCFVQQTAALVSAFHLKPCGSSRSSDRGSVYARDHQ